MTVTVPQGAQQVLVFLAPHTGGDLRTLVGAVRGRPGAFVRTTQDLNQAALDRSRLERFLSAVHLLNEGDPSKLQEAAPLLARSLAIKVEDKCLDRIPELQAPCLMQGQESLILNDGHSTSIVEALTSGPGSDLAMEASYTPQLSYGYYSPVHCLGAGHCAHHGVVSDRAISIHSCIGFAARRQARLDPEHAAFLSQPDVRVGDRAAGRRVSAAAAAACGGSQGDFLCAPLDPGIARRWRAPGIFDRLCARSHAQRDWAGRQNNRSPGEGRPDPGRLCGRHRRLGQVGARRQRSCIAQGLLGLRALRGSDISSDQRPRKILGTRCRR